MKKNYKLSIFILVTMFLLKQEINAQSICNPEGNLFIFANYDGGILNIDVDVDIADIKIGIVSYEATEVNFTGDYVSNITAVKYAGFNSDNDNCNLGILNTTFAGIDSALTEILFYPPGTIFDEGGNSNIVCGYSCGSGDGGGCNTANEILNYFTTTLGGTVNSYTTQYGCWEIDYTLLGTSGNCCEEFTSPPIANVFVLATSICVGDCIDYIDASGNLPTTWNWNFEGAETDSSNIQNPTGICYLSEGTFTSSLSVENEFGTDITTIEITVGNAEVGNAEITEVGNTLTASPDGLDYQWYTCAGSFAEIVGATSETFTPFANGLYAVVVSNNGCRDTSACTGFSISSINEALQIKGVSMYPNPFKNGFYFEDNLQQLKGGEIKLFNALGQLILSKAISQKETFVETNFLNEGIYYLEARNIKNFGVYRIIKE